MPRLASLKDVGRVGAFQSTEGSTAEREALGRILASSDFDQSELVRGVLIYIVNETLCGHQDHIETFTIAKSVFGRDESYDEQTDPIVQLVGSRLRRSLERYYAGEGRHEPLRVRIRKGSYEPVFFDTSHASSRRQRNQNARRLSRLAVCPADSVDQRAHESRSPETIRCPICGCTAINLTVLGSMVSSVRCLLVDGEFDVADNCSERLEELDLGERHLVLNKAIRFATTGRRPCITRFSLWQVTRQQSELG